MSGEGAAARGGGIAPARARAVGASAAPGPGLVPGGVVRARASLAAGSKSFALAGRLLPRRCRDDAAVVYAFCRRADDLVDHAPPGQVAAAVARLRGEVAALFAGKRPGDPVLAAFQEVAGRRGIPRWLVDELIAGFAMDARPLPIVYRTWGEVLLYCFRVAGTVGLMMCRVMGTRDARAARHAAALGMAMQLTNIARDVAEDWARGRLYLPAEALAPATVDVTPGVPLDPATAAVLARAVPSLLAAAEPFYVWGDAGLPALDARSALAARTARLVYSAIGDRLSRRACDVTAPRAVVSRARKLCLLARAALGVACDRLLRRRRRSPALPPLPGPLPLSFLRLPEPLP